MKKILLLKYGEIALKGLNRPKFEKMLSDNIDNSLRCYGRIRIEREQSTMTLEHEDDSFDMEKIIPAVQKIFGIVSINLAIKVAKNIDEIKKAALEYALPHLRGAKSFAVIGKRSDKTFPMKSPEIAGEIGGLLYDASPGIKIDLTNPEVKVTVEIRGNGAFIHAKTFRGAGGMPTGSNGNGLLLLSGGIDSPVAGYMMARRGMKLTALHFTSEPYTSSRSKEKVERLADIVSQYSGTIDFVTISLTSIQEAIRDNCNNDYLTIILRRAMMIIAQRVAKKKNCDCIITGESLGQVASQTIEAIKATDAAADIPVFRPCIGLDKSQIIETAEKIGTYETSIEPYDDCCTVFTPKHPVTRPKMYAVLSEEGKINLLELIDEVCSNLS